MGFFKDLREDVSQAMSELITEEVKEKAADEKNSDEEEEKEQLVNTLDFDEIASDDTSDSEKMKEWLEELDQKEAGQPDAEDIWSLETDQEIMDVAEINIEDTDEAKEIYQTEEDEENTMVENDNVDLELLAALNEEEQINETETEEKAEVKPRAASAASEDDVTVITKGTTINGSISSDGSLEVCGTIVGDVECLGKLSITGKVKGNSSAAEVYVNTERLEGGIVSEGSVKIGLGTVVIGDIAATSGVIAGAVKGEVDINGPIVIDSTAIIKGNIKGKSIQINNGAIIEGFCSLSYSSVDVDNIFE
ncbi:cytoskeletal protein CcmA (bactofilin family) [Anaerotaenia torta]|uniref:bactofilin family protein n=1 Tax=Anaerotaenia torta TaxID=433293 RepID=UPI003D1BD3FF